MLNSTPIGKVEFQNAVRQYADILDLARLDMQNVFAIFLFTETNPQPFPCLSLLREYVYLPFILLEQCDQSYDHCT